MLAKAIQVLKNSYASLLQTKSNTAHIIDLNQSVLSLKLLHERTISRIDEHFSLLESSDQLLQLIWQQTERYKDQKSLSRFDARVYSQNGEDGIVAEIFNRIGTTDKFFVEIGIGDGTQNNTRFLLEQGWSGIWIDGSEAGITQARSRFKNYVSKGKLNIIKEMITVDNINLIMCNSGINQKFDFLSLDIDQNTSHVWRSLKHTARVSCLEYNSSLPPSTAVEVPYSPDENWDGTNWFGASLKTLEHIGNQKELELVGCDLNGINAFFVDKTAAKGLFLESTAAEYHYEPPRYNRATMRRGHPPAPYNREWLSHRL